MRAKKRDVRFHFGHHESWTLNHFRWWMSLQSGLSEVPWFSKDTYSWNWQYETATMVRLYDQVLCQVRSKLHQDLRAVAVWNWLMACQQFWVAQDLELQPTNAGSFQRQRLNDRDLRCLVSRHRCLPVSTSSRWGASDHLHVQISDASRTSLLHIRTWSSHLHVGRWVLEYLCVPQLLHASHWSWCWQLVAQDITSSICINGQTGCSSTPSWSFTAMVNKMPWQSHLNCPSFHLDNPATTSRLWWHHDPDNRRQPCDFSGDIGHGGCCHVSRSRSSTSAKNSWDKTYDKC